MTRRDMDTRWINVVLCSLIVVAMPTLAVAQPARIYVEGSPKALKNELLTLLRQTSDLLPVPSFKKPEANLNLQKAGGAKVKCGGAKTLLPGPSAADIVTQFRAWLPTPLAQRRAGQADRDRRNTAIAAAIMTGTAVTAAALAGGSGSSAYAAGADAGSSTTKLMLFGGEGHKTYLGCLTCSKYDIESIENTYGTFGSRYSTTSVLNLYSEFGSHYSAFGACNPYASDPPVIVDHAGNAYGRLSVNRSFVLNAQWRAWIEEVCAR
jgi:hypothetical protein